MRRQRAGKSAEQSTPGSSDQVIEGAGMRLLYLWGDTVVVSHFAVYPCYKRRWKIERLLA